MQVKHSGTWKNTTPACKVGGSWVTPKEVWVKHAGVWKKEWSAYLYALTVTCGVLVSQYDANNYAEYKGFESDGLSYTPISGGSVAPTSVAGYQVLTAYLYRGTGNAWATFSANVVMRLIVPVGAGGGWLDVRGMVINGVTILGRFQREYDGKSNAILDRVQFLPGATSNDLGTVNYDTYVYTDEQRIAVGQLSAAMTQGGTFTIFFI